MSRKQFKRLQALVKTYNCIPGFTFIVNQKWKNKIYKLLKVDHRIPVLQLARFRSNKQKETGIWIEKNDCKFFLNCSGDEVDGNQYN